MTSNHAGSQSQRSHLGRPPTRLKPGSPLRTAADIDPSGQTLLVRRMSLDSYEHIPHRYGSLSPGATEAGLGHAGSTTVHSRHSTGMG